MGDYILESLLYRKQQLEQNYWCDSCQFCWCDVSVPLRDEGCDYCQVTYLIKQLDDQIQILTTPPPQEQVEVVSEQPKLLSEKQKKTKKKEIKNIKAERQRKMVNNKV